VLETQSHRSIYQLESDSEADRKQEMSECDGKTDRRDPSHKGGASESKNLGRLEAMDRATEERKDHRWSGNWCPSEKTIADFTFSENMAFPPFAFLPSASLEYRITAADTIVP
jgi:hypothetical protein